jgi:glycosyltransferase involved in cell wall biosynthesis
MRIAIDATFRVAGGAMIHLRQLLKEWHSLRLDREHSLVLFTRPENLDKLGPLDDGIELVTMSGSDINAGVRLLWQQFRLPELVRRARADVLFCPGNISPFRCSVPVVVVLQNAAPFCTSITPRSTGLVQWLSFRVLGWMMRFSARRADRVVFLSEYFRDLFVRRFGFPIERGDVIYHGRDSLAGTNADPLLLERLGISRPFILSVSHLYRYKNLPALIEGYALEREALQARGLRLVIVGSKVVDPGSYREIRRRVDALGLQDWIVFPGPVPHDQVSTLMRECEFFVFQSTCENFSVALIEALAAGVPIASSNAGVMPEIGGDAPLYFDPSQPQSIAEVLARMAGDAELRREMGRKALQQAVRFPNWEQVATMTMQSLERAAGCPAESSAHPASNR